MTWINELKPYTKNIIINHTEKSILLVHPHFESGIKGFRHLIKAIKNNTYKGYQVQAVGFCTLPGARIIKQLQKIINKFDTVDYTILNFRGILSSYTLTVQFK